jgi:hypothetical protein
MVDVKATIGDIILFITKQNSMNDNFNFKQFITENKLGPFTKIVEEIEQPQTEQSAQQNLDKVLELYKMAREIDKQGEALTTEEFFQIVNALHSAMKRLKEEITFGKSPLSK